MLCIGGIYFVGLLGEVMCEIGLSIKNYFKPKKSIVATYTNGCIGVKCCTLWMDGFADGWFINRPGKVMIFRQNGCFGRFADIRFEHPKLFVWEFILVFLPFER